MKILVIGANGFLGSKVVETIPQENTIFANIRSDTPNFTKKENIEIFKQDLSNLDLSIFPKNIDVIFYLAQSRNYKKFPEYADEILNINLIVPMKIAQWAIKNKVKKFVYISTGGVYNFSSIHLQSFQPKLY
ncbi:MAG: NAD(P)-dependent oxidoreductase [Candidatus Calescibacterium sp.]|nr:NAD(P)-dependent oxidoreductase [Candidatus Calescibacterium sp.]MDW8194961.1 NAD(P)-dependent oxidoreductase [Candidatus Calescibacterium sp.]